MGQKALYPQSQACAEAGSEWLRKCAGLNLLSYIFVCFWDEGRVDWPFNLQGELTVRPLATRRKHSCVLVTLLAQWGQVSPADGWWCKWRLWVS